MVKKPIPLKQSSRADDFDKIVPHLKGFMHVIETIDNESDRGMVLILSGFLEEALKKMLVGFFQEKANVHVLFESGNSPLGSFSSRIHLCHALGILNDEELSKLNTIRGIRNDFAHEVGAAFDVPSIRSGARNLVEATNKQTSRQMFQFGAISLIIGILRRYEHFKKNRRPPLDPRLVTKWEAVAAVPANAELISTGKHEK